MSNQYYFFGTRATFIQATPKIFCRVNGAYIMTISLMFIIAHLIN